MIVTLEIGGGGGEFEMSSVTRSPEGTERHVHAT